MLVVCLGEPAQIAETPVRGNRGDVSVALQQVLTRAVESDSKQILGGGGPVEIVECVLHAACAEPGHAGEVAERIRLIGRRFEGLDDGVERPAVQALVRLGSEFPRARMLLGDKES